MAAFCPICGMPRRRDHKTCSRSCGQRSRWNKQPPGNCLVCGEPNKDAKRQTCSIKCGRFLGRMNDHSISLTHRAWLRQEWIKQQALREFPHGLIRRIPTGKGTMYLLMQRERGER